MRPGGRFIPSEKPSEIDCAAVILLYHRVMRLESDPQLLSVAPNRFEKHIAYLRDNAIPLSLTDLIESQEAGRNTERAVVVTFDDGYADNLHNARPILERYGVPATVFVTTSGLNAEREFWWDDLERLLLATPSKLTKPARISIGGFDMCLPAGAYRPMPAYARWSVLQSSAPTARHAVYRDICEAIRPLPADQRRETIERVEVALGLKPGIRPTHRAMNRSGLRRLAEGGLIDIGAHTLTHPVLASLTPEEQRREIVDARRILEEVIGSAVQSFSYPFGGRSDYSPETVELVRREGFRCACANVPDLVTAESDPMQLPRRLVRDWSAQEFAERFESFWSSNDTLAARSAD
jgi:peptidoglycan/xylan/chitin deacetylase (PgdA/CDA1 family)